MKETPLTMSEEDFELELANWQDPILTALHAICLPFVLPREAYYLSRFAFKWMVKDRSSYVLREEGRAKWNARAKHEKMLQRTAIYMANEWTCNRRPVCNCFNSTESGGLTELVCIYALHPFQPTALAPLSAYHSPSRALSLHIFYTWRHQQLSNIFINTDRETLLPSSQPQKPPPR